MLAKGINNTHSSIQGFYYHTSHLLDLLSKREYLYRHLIEKRNHTVFLPKSLTTSPQNPILMELKSSFRFIDPTVFTSESTRDLYYTSLSYFNFLIVRDLLNFVHRTIPHLPINTSALDNFFFYFFNTSNSNKAGLNAELYKNQFRPLRKGITNMLKLHGTGAIAMPIETRIQILASSKDVIHS